jgi:hypothetical protein
MVAVRAVLTLVQGDLRVDLGAIVIDDEAGDCEPELGELVPNLAALASAATAAVGGSYIEPWRWALPFIRRWAAEQGVEVVAVDEPEPWPPLPPGAVAASSVEP